MHHLLDAVMRRGHDAEVDAETTLGWAGMTMKRHMASAVVPLTSVARSMYDMPWHVVGSCAADSVALYDML